MTDSQTDSPADELPVRLPLEYAACDPDALPSAETSLVRAIQERFLGAFAAGLADRLETQISGKLISAQPLSRGAFLESIEDGGCLVTLSAEPARSEALISLSPSLVDCLLGILLGAPSSSGGERRTVTEIELYLLQEIFELFASELTNAWKATGIAFQQTSRPRPAWQGTMLVFECLLEFGDSQQTFRLAAPAFLARLAAVQLSSVAPQESPGPVREMILSALRGAKVTVEAVLPGSTLRMSDLLSMEPGNILTLGQPIGSPVEIRISGKRKFRGEWVAYGKRNALIIQ